MQTAPKGRNNLARGASQETCREAIQTAPKGRNNLARGASPETSDDATTKPLRSPEGATENTTAGASVR